MKKNVYIRFSKTYVVDEETALKMVEDVTARETDAINEFFLEGKMLPHVTIADFDIDDEKEVHEKVENDIRSRKEFIEELREEGYSEGEIEFALALKESME